MISIVAWNESDWSAYRSRYEDLLAHSSADRLFLSWDWIDLWWKHLYPRRTGDEFRVYAAQDDGLLIGALPILIADTKRQGLRYKSANIAGACVRESRGVFSEYLDVVARDGYGGVRSELTKFLIEREGCDEVSIGTSLEYDTWASDFRSLNSTALRFVRTIDPMTSYQADLSSGFARYVQSLGGNSRRSLYHLRRRLEDKGRIRFEIVHDNIEVGLAELNELHRQRWDSPAFSGASLAFYRELISRWSSDGSIQLCRLFSADQCISVLFDIRRLDIQYNIQMGFRPDFDRSISLGLLHLGYAMEHAAVEGVKTYDFLAGSGKTTDYKKRIATASRNVASVQYFCSALTAMTYRTHDWIRAFGIWRS